MVEIIDLQRNKKRKDRREDDIRNNSSGKNNEEKIKNKKPKQINDKVRQGTENDLARFKVIIEGNKKLSSLSPGRLKEIFEIKDIFERKFHYDHELLENIINKMRAKGNDYLFNILEKEDLSRIDDDSSLIVKVYVALFILLYDKK